MERIFHGDDGAAAAQAVGVFAGDLDGPFHRFGAAVGEENAIDARQLHQPLRQLDLRFADEEVGDVDQLFSLFLDGFHYPGMAVAQVIDRNAGQGIQVFPALDIPQFGAPAFAEGQGVALEGRQVVFPVDLVQ